MHIIRSFPPLSAKLLYTSSRAEASAFSKQPNQVAVIVVDRKVNTDLGVYCDSISCADCPLDTRNLPTHINCVCSAAAQKLLELSSHISKPKDFHG